VENDVNALKACRTKARQSPGFSEILPTMTMPCLLFAGEDDPVYAENQECSRSMPNVTFFSLPGLGQWQGRGPRSGPAAQRSCAWRGPQRRLASALLVHAISDEARAFYRNSGVSGSHRSSR